MKEVSAIIFNCNATWSKLMSRKRSFMFLANEGLVKSSTYELIQDGLFVFHNPYATFPLDKSIFRKKRVCQLYLGKITEKKYQRRYNARFRKWKQTDCGT